MGKNNTISGKPFSAGDSVTCEVTPFDGTNYGQPDWKAVIISN
jgi:hypothetical protein